MTIAYLLIGIGILVALISEVASRVIEAKTEHDAANRSEPNKKRR